MSTTLTRPDGTPRTHQPHPDLNMRLAARLSRAGIIASLCLDRPSSVPKGDAVIGFRLHEHTRPKEFDNGEEYKGDPDERIPGAACDYSLAQNCKEGWLEEWMKEVDRAHKVVCDHFGITEQHVFVHEKTGQLILHVFRGKRDESCRWLHGFGWVGW